MSSIAVIIVLYKNDNFNYLEINHNSGDIKIILVDNTPGRNLNLQDSNLYYIPLRENNGIAEAQNIGIEKALELNCDYAVFFDHDSIIPSNFPTDIISEYKRIEQSTPNLFLLGPIIINGKTNKAYSSQIHKYHETDGFSERSSIISSGSCVKLSKVKEVGKLDSSLFIDLVDHEWCWRAASKGFVNGITTKVTLTHYVGHKLFKLGPIQFIVSSPFRYFYQTRNTLWMLHRTYVPTQWKRNSLIKLFTYPLLYPFATKSWPKIYYQMTKGFFAGLKPQKKLIP